MNGALGVYGIAPEVFWRMTPREFQAFEQGRLLLNPNYVEPLDRDEYEEMKRRFPDG